MRAFCWVSILIIEISRSDEKLEAFTIGGWPAVTNIHVSATDPLSAWRDTDLIGASRSSSATIPNYGACSMRTMPLIVTWHQSIVSTRIGA
jgi:hypothetical protein